MLSLTTLLVKEQISFLRLSDTYNIYDPSNGNQVGEAKETNPLFFKILRLLMNKRFLPTTVEVSDTTGKPLFYIKKGPQFINATVKILDANKVEVGYLKSKFFTLGGGFYIFDTQDNQFAEVKGDWKGWNFKFIGKNNLEIGTVTKKWAGLGKELFTSADNYVISLTNAESNPAKCILLLAAGLAIDIVFKENR